jgi:hypothetical protein
MLAATLVPEHCSSGHRGKFCRWSHFISFCLCQHNRQPNKGGQCLSVCQAFASLRKSQLRLPGTGNAPGRSIELENIESETGRILGSESISGDSALRSRFEAGDTLFGKLCPYLRKFANPAFEGFCSTEIWARF